MKKKEKKKFVRKDVRLCNIGAGDPDSFDLDEVIPDRRSEKKTVEKGGSSGKSRLSMKPGRVMEITSQMKCNVLVEDGVIACRIGGRLKQINFETRTILAIGDYVRVAMSAHPRVEEIEPRYNALSRFSPGQYQTEIVIASNLDLLMITASWADPPFKPGLVDRYLCIAALNDIEPVICINKVDLAGRMSEVREWKAIYESSGVPVFLVSAETGYGLDDLRDCLVNRTTVFSGHSGVGKSSLINALHPGLALDTSDVSLSTGKGRHTTSSGRLIPWIDGGYLVDTPGIKTLNLHKSHRERIPKCFPGFEVLYDHCYFPDCSHTHEEGCAVKQAVAVRTFNGERYESYLRIMESLE